MPKSEDLARLTRHGWLSTMASLAVLLAGLIGLALYFQPSLAGIDATTRGGYKGEIGWLLTGVVLTTAGIVFVDISNRWPRYLKRTVLGTSPVRRAVRLEVERDNDGTAYYAVINNPSVEAGGTMAWRAHIWIYPPQINKDMGREFEGDAFLHPRTGLPVAIEYDRGMLWVIAGNGAVQRIPSPESSHV